MAKDKDKQVNSDITASAPAHYVAGYSVPVHHVKGYASPSQPEVVAAGTPAQDIIASAPAHYVSGYSIPVHHVKGYASPNAPEVVTAKASSASGPQGDSPELQNLLGQIQDALATKREKTAETKTPVSPGKKR